MSRYIWVLLSFLIITIPGAFNDWFSLFERFGSDNDDQLKISFGDWYQAIFPILGFLVLAFGIWWTKSKDKTGNLSQSNITPEKGNPEGLTPDIEEAKASSPALQNSASQSRSSSWSLSPSELVANYKDRTTTEAEKLVSPQLGKKLFVRVRVRDVEEDIFEENRFKVYSKDVDSEIAIFATFEESWSEEIKRLQVNQVITLFGKIHRISRNIISLESCEIIMESHG